MSVWLDLEGYAVLQLVLVSGLSLLLAGALVRTFQLFRPWRELSRGEIVALVLCLALALVTRLALEPMPADMQLTTPQGLGIPHGHRWAAAFSVMLHALFLVAPADLGTVTVANAVLGAGSVLAVYALVRVTFEERTAALASAALLACHPISIRFSASDSAHVLATVAALMALTFTAIWMRRGGELWVFQAAGWLAVCANARDEGLVVAAAALCVAGGMARRESLPPWQQWVGGALFGLVLVVMPLQRTVLEVLLSPATGRVSWDGVLRSPFFLSPHSPAITIGLALVGVVVVLVRSEGRRLGLLWLLALIPMTLPTNFIPGPAWENTHRQCLPSLTMFLVISGLGLGWLVSWGARGFEKLGRPAAGVAFRLSAPLLVAMLSVLGHTELMTKTWTHQLEYRFLHDHLGAVPDGSTLVGIGLRNGHVGLGIVPALSAAVGRNHRWVELAEFLRVPRIDKGGVVFVESAACHAVHWYQPRHWHASGIYAECRQVMERFRLEPLVTGRVPAQPFGGEEFLVDPIPLGLHRVAGLR